MIKTEAEKMLERMSIYGDVTDEQRQEVTADDLRETLKLQYMAYSGKEHVADVRTDVFRLIYGGGVVHYFEAITTSVSNAQGIMGALSSSTQLKYYWYIKGVDWVNENFEVKMPLHASCYDVKLKIQDYNGTLVHIAMVNRSPNFIIVKNSDALWGKVREHLTCPTLPEWGIDLTPKLLKAEVIRKCNSIGLTDDMQAYCFHADSNENFDKLVSEYVRRYGFNRQVA